MIRGLKILITVLFWVQAFVTPVILSGLIWLLTGSKKLFIPFMITGGVIGIVVAEYIRQKIGLDVFFGRIYGPNQMDEKIKKKTKQLFYKLSSDDKPLRALKQYSENGEY